MVNFSYATPWLLHASLFSCKDDATQEHPHASFASAAFHASERHVRPMSGMSKRRTKSPPPSKEDGGLRCSRIDGVRSGRAAGGLMAGALQELGRQALRKGLTGRCAARGETAGAPPDDIHAQRVGCAPQGAKRRVRRKELGRRVRCKGRNGRRAAGAKLRRSARGSAADADCVPPPHRARRKASAPPRHSGPTSLCGRRLRC